MLPNRFRSFSLCSCSVFLLHRFPSQGFEEARAASRIVRVRPAAPPTCSCLVRRSEQRSASVRRPVRCSLVSSLCPIAGCTPLITYLLEDISIYSFVASICVVVYPRSLCCRAVSLCDPRSCVIGSLSFSSLACSSVQDPRGPASFLHALA